MGRDIVDAWTPRIRCRPVPRPSLIDFSADGLGSDRRDWTTVHALERREKINHVDLTVRIGSGNLQCNPNGSDVISRFNLPVIQKEPQQVGVLDRFPRKSKGVEVLFIRKRKAKLTPKGRSAAALRGVLGHRCEPFYMMLVEVDFLFWLDGLRLFPREVFIQLEFVGGFSDEFKNLFSCKLRSVNDALFFVDADDIALRGGDGLLC